MLASQSTRPVARSTRTWVPWATLVLFASASCGQASCGQVSCGQASCGQGKDAFAPDQKSALPSQSSPSDPPQGLTKVEWGEHLFVHHGCIGCHSVAGVNSVGGHLDHAYGTQRALEDGTEVIMDDAYIRRSLLDPQAQTLTGFSAPMPSYHGLLSDAQIEAITAFIKAIR